MVHLDFEARYAPHLGIHIHNIYRNVVDTAHIVQFFAELLRIIGIAVGSLADGLIRRLNHLRLAADIIIFQGAKGELIRTIWGMGYKLEEEKG